MNKKKIQLTTDYWIDYNEWLFEIKFTDKQRREYLEYINKEGNKFSVSEYVKYKCINVGKN